MFLFHYSELNLTMWNYPVKLCPRQDGKRMAMKDATAAGEAGLRVTETRRDTGTLGKLMRLVDLVATAREPLRFSDILAQSGEPRGTVHRQLSHLLEEGLLETGADGCYRPGLRLLTLASEAWSRNDFRTVAAPHLQALHAATGETVHLGVLRGQDVVYLDKVESRQSVRMHSEVGRASPLHCTGIGKAALSILPPEHAADLITTLPLKAFTATTLTSVKALEAELASIRRLGHAFDREEHEAGIRCVAAPIAGGQGGFAAGVSVTGPAYRVAEEQLLTWAPLVRETARRISDETAIRLGPRP